MVQESTYPPIMIALIASLFGGIIRFINEDHQNPLTTRKLISCLLTGIFTGLLAFIAMPHLPIKIKDDIRICVAGICGWKADIILKLITDKLLGKFKAL